MKRIAPSEDRLVVEPQEPEKETAGGIIIPDVGQEKSAIGTVVAVGPGILEMAAAGGPKHRPIEYKVGDTVLYGRFAGTEITLDGRDVLLLRASDVLATVYEVKDAA